MAKSIVQFKTISEKLSFMPEVSFRAMMGEYVLYYNGKVIGGIYDSRLLVKPVAGLENLLPEASLQLPYEGAKPQVLSEQSYLGKPELIKRIFEEVYNGLPDKKQKR